MEQIDMKKVAQLGIVVENAKEAMEAFCRMFRVPEEYTVLLHVKEGQNGSRFTADFGWVNYCGIQFEFIQPISGDLGTYGNFLKQTGGGIHHIAFTSQDPASLLEAFRAEGASEVTPGSDLGKIQDPSVGYFDFHREMGLCFEVSTKNMDAMTTMSFEMLRKQLGQ